MTARDAECGSAFAAAVRMRYDDDARDMSARTCRHAALIFSCHFMMMFRAAESLSLRCFAAPLPLFVTPLTYYIR